MKNYDYIFIGTGFSSLIFKILSKNKKKIFITSENIDLKANFLRRKEYEYKKLFSKNFYSYNNIKISNLINQKFHDNLSHGGNSNLWGGIIQINQSLKKLFNHNRIIKLKKLSYKFTGSQTNKKNIYQLRNLNDQILSSRDIIKNPTFGHVTKIKKKKNFFEVSYKNKKNKNIIILGKKIFFGTSFIQFLEILINSNFIIKNSKVSLEEFPMQYRLSLKKKIIDRNNFVIKYSLPGVIKHSLGMQKKLKFNILNILPIFVEQIFYKKRKKLEFVLFTKKKILSILSPSKNTYFGSSIHYCNLKINNTSAQKFLQKISPNLYGVSMPFVEQKRPSPISTNISENLIKYYTKKFFW